MSPGPGEDGGVTVSRESTAAPWRRYVALGDSFTEGLWDPDPADPTTLRGWADRMAYRLSADRQARGEAPLEYANLAVRGLTLPTITEEQVPRALELGPDLVSLVGGGNDMMRPAVDVDGLAARLEENVAQLRAAGIDVLLATGMDTADSPLLRALRGRIAVFNAHVWSIARRHGAFVLDVWGMRSLRDWRMWDADRIHLTPRGHARVAQAALVALGQRPDDPAWDEPLPPLPEPPRAVRVRSDLEWLRVHVYPWAARGLLGRPAWTDPRAKLPDLVPLTGPPPERSVGPEGEGAERLDAVSPAREDGHEAVVVPVPDRGRDRNQAARDGARGRTARNERTTPVSDRIDYTTMEDPEIPGETGIIRSTRHSGDVLHGGHPEAAPDHVIDQFEQKSGLVGASPDGSPDEVELYGSGQDDGQMV
jgi:lysophospholipase L1-like esterase